ncbi:MAG: hypothetical protein IJS74_01760 [Clostridia bacterium]|nr:hypothetical protein [Clostridia bacterium]
MSDCFKCGLISLGIGMAAGIYVATNNKKLQNFVKETEAMIEEKFDVAKKGVSDLQDKYTKDNDDESFIEIEENFGKSSNKSNKKKK